MKKIISIFLSAILALSIGITVSAESEVVIFWNAIIDILEMPGLMIEYKTNKDAARKYLNENAPEDFTYNFAAEMDTISTAGYILLPEAVDFEKIKPGDFTVSVDAGGEYYSVYGSAEDMDYRISVSEEITNLPNNPEKDITTRRRSSFNRATIDWNSFGGDRLYINIDSRLPLEELEEFAHNLALKPYPLKNGFINIGDNRYYGYNGALLKGWYKIGGEYYYFDEDNVAAKGEYKIGDILYTFDENGVYKSSKRI
ncbi:MAG: hypothetical protein LBM41_02800 [Ruminococcus sp.]|jgi:hypothetical protein|nr:hypothetical protein [Ruminococcus sp.]